VRQPSSRVPDTVHVVLGTDRRGSEAIAHLLPSLRGRGLQKLLPYLAVVSNRSSKSIVALSVTFAGADADGHTSRVTLQLKYPDAVDPENPYPPSAGEPLRSDQSKVLCPHYELADDMDAELIASTAAREYEGFGVRIQKVVVDAVIWQDGELQGPDDSRLGAHFSAYVDAKQQLYQRVQQRLGAGESIEDIKKSLKPSGPLSGEALASDIAVFYRFQAAGEFVQLANVLEPGTVSAVLGAAIRSDPFRVFRR
jgi:hypothetical protein